jgi:hypothetical protein
VGAVCGDGQDGGEHNLWRPRISIPIQDIVYTWR